MLPLSKYIAQKSRRSFILLWIFTLICISSAYFGILYVEDLRFLKDQMQVSYQTVASSIEENDLNAAIRSLNYFSQISGVHSVELDVGNNRIAGPIGTPDVYNLSVCYSEKPDSKFTLRGCKAVIDAQSLTTSLAIILILTILVSFSFIYVLRTSGALLKKVSHDLSVNEQTDGRKSEIYEINAIKDKISALYGEIAVQKQKAVLYDLSKQVAHDIRSPLAALNVGLSDLQSVPTDKKNLLENAVNRINDIANDLLKKNVSASSFDGQITSSSILSCIKNICDEKKLLLQGANKVSINIENSDDVYFSKINLGIFKRIISNILNNSIEAMSVNGGAVNIRLSNEVGTNVISIADNGKGISEELIPKLASEGETHGKEGGTGLGLYHAKKYIENWGGTLKIMSVLGKGTTILLTLPASPSAESKKYILIDDDSIIRMTWKMASKKAGCPFESYSGVDEFKIKLPEVPRNTVIYIDSDLSGVKGELYAKELFELGFKEIYLSTGYEKSDFPEMPWIKDVVGKAPPW